MPRNPVSLQELAMNLKVAPRNPVSPETLRKSCLCLKRTLVAHRVMVEAIRLYFAALP
jgi:hypothetical protein